MSLSRAQQDSAVWKAQYKNRSFRPGFKPPATLTHPHTHTHTEPKGAHIHMDARIKQVCILEPLPHLDTYINTLTIHTRQVVSMPVCLYVCVRRLKLIPLAPIESFRFTAAINCDWIYKLRGCTSHTYRISPNTHTHTHTHYIFGH